MVNQCVYVEWYRFKQCTITSCKNWTSITSSRCMAIDRVQPAGNKVITDAELHMYKFPDEGISTRLVSMRRKEALTRVKSVLILHEFIKHLHKKHYNTAMSIQVGARHSRIESIFPLKIKKLKFESWMWPYILSDAEYKEFTQSKDGECSTFALHELLHVTPMKFQVLKNTLTKD